MTSVTTEAAFEEAIHNKLCAEGGYESGNSSEFSRELALHKKTVLRFIKDSQPEAWQKLSDVHGANVENKFILRLCNELDHRGMLDVLRHGITDYGVRLKLAFFKPANTLNPETLELYSKNILSVTRQLKYSQKNENSVDLLLSVNGLPVATVELKNAFTGQTASNAKRQYIKDRDPRELLFQFKKRALVHFAVDTDEAWMTTRLDGPKTRYLPFNLGCGNGAGNPTNPDGYKTAYLWERIWTRDSWLEILGTFMHLQVQELKVDNRLVKKEAMIFPRFHQLDAVRSLSADAYQNGPGQNYLIQHSAGSGKSNSIAWLSYRLSSLHNAANKRVFDSVIVITDRRVLDFQLQDTIYQFEHKAGVVQKIDKHSSQLADALAAGTNIVITTLQKFPFVLEKVGILPDRNYAVIVDEAHSSQGGEASKKMKEVLTVIDLEKAVEEDPAPYGSDDDDPEDDIRKSMLARGKQPNMSFFAFTATPKQKTLAVFGTPDAEGNPQPFHLYSMRQAIEEGFIMDVLENYTTYKTFFRLTKQIEDDPDINKKKAARAIGRFISLHPHNLAQKTEVIVEHFRNCVMHKIGGKAKAMVVTSSRPHVVRYKEEFDRYIMNKGYSDVRTLVAFTTFTDCDSGIEYKEADINEFPETELPKKFGTPEYQLLIVAEKYQTGFDQPLLHTMYVDKKLSGVKAVQTLSRLNRISPGKEDTFVLDFANDEEEILDSFQPYYEQTRLTGETDPNKLYDIKSKIEGYQIVWPSEIDNFSKVFFREKTTTPGSRAHAKLNSTVDPSVDRAKALDDEALEEFKHLLTTFTRLYSFLAQIMPFGDVELEKFYAFCRLLITKLPKREGGGIFQLQGEVALEYYRLEKIRDGSIPLEQGSDAGLDPISDAGTRKDKEEQAKLSEIITLLNDRFATDFDSADKLFFDQIEEELVNDEALNLQGQSNTKENFKYGFEDAFIGKLIERMEDNQDIFAKIMDDKDFRDAVQGWMLDKVYKRITQDV